MFRVVVLVLLSDILVMWKCGGFVGYNVKKGQCYLSEIFWLKNK